MNKYKLTILDTDGKAAHEELMKSIKEYVSVIKAEQRLKRKYPAGTCNAEDAWKDFGERQSASEANLKRLAKCKVKTHMTKLQQASYEVFLSGVKAAKGSSTVLECAKQYGFTGPFTGMDKYYDDIYQMSDDLEKELNK